MNSYVFEHGTQASTGLKWGLGAVLSDAEGSTGQTASSDNWAAISAGLKSSPTTAPRKRSKPRDIDALSEDD